MKKLDLQVSSLTRFFHIYLKISFIIQNVLRDLEIVYLGFRLFVVGGLDAAVNRVNRVIEIK